MAISNWGDTMKQMKPRKISDTPMTRLKEEEEIEMKEESILELCGNTIPLH